MALRGCGRHRAPRDRGLVPRRFEPTTEAETTELAKLTHDLSFDPTKEVGRLNSTTRGSPRDPKRILERLAPTPERKRACLERPLSDLVALSQDSGLREFLDEVATRIIPRF